MSYDFTIIIKNNRATFVGDFPIAFIRQITSYQSPGHKYSDAYKRKYWDGLVHLTSLTTNSMPAGLVDLVVREVKKEYEDCRIKVIDTRENLLPEIDDKQHIDLNGIKFGQDSYSYQIEAVKALIKAKRGLLKAATNSGKTEIYCALIKHTKLPTLILVTSLDLVRQIKERISVRLQLPIDQIGTIAEGVCEIGEWVTVATPQSLLPHLLHDEYVQLNKDRWLIVISDECHHLGSHIFYDVLDQLDHCPHRFGGSGTPIDRTDGADLRIMAQTGDIVYEITNKQLIELGVSVAPHITMVPIRKPKLPARGLSWAEVREHGIVKNQALNEQIIVRVQGFKHSKLQSLIFVEQIEHGKSLLKLMPPNVKTKFLSGKESTKDRDKLLKNFDKGQIDCLIMTSIGDEGLDLPAVDAIVFATGGKSKIRTLQRIGRGLRLNKGKNKLIVIDYANTCHKWLIDHTLKRIKAYKDEGFEVTVED